MEDCSVDGKECQFCHKSFVCTTRLVRHTYKFHLEKIANQWIPCSFCFLLFPSNTSLKDHVTNFHRGGKKNKSDTNEQPRIKCFYCQKTFTKQTSMVRHCRLEHKDSVAEIWVKCGVCQSTHPTAEDLKSHMTYYHSKNRLDYVPDSAAAVAGGMRCQFCQASFPMANYLIRHSNKVHHDLIAGQWLPCTSCSLFYPTNISLKAHVSSAHGRFGKKSKPKPKEEERLTCEFCPVSYTRSDAVVKHCNTVHADLLPEHWFMCEVCKMFFPTKYSLKVHRSCAHSAANNNSHPKFNTVCQFCQKTFKEKKYFHFHANQQHLDKISSVWSSCPDCGVFRPDEQSIKWHQKSAHGNILVKTPSHICQFCDSTFTQRYTYYKHANTKHQDEISAAWLPCGDCSEFYPRQDVLQLHNRNKHQTTRTDKNNQKILCSFCPNTYCGVKSYHQHCNSEHKTEIQDKWLTCNHCQLMFPNTKSLQRHTIALHLTRLSSKKSVKCFYCTKKFKTTNRYWQHANEDHSKEVSQDWFDCDMCDNYYPSPESLKIHSSCHSEVNKRPCDFCSLAIGNNNYNKHVNLLHKTEASSKWVTCEHCSYLLPDQQALKNHCRASHTLTTTDSQLIKCSFKSCKVELESKSKSEFYSHANKCHYKIVAEKWKRCNKCKLYLPSISALRDHKVRSCVSLKLKSGTPECQFCLMSFNKTWQYYKHVNKEHRDAASGTWLLCQQCAKLYPTEGVLNSHIASAHDVIEVFDTCETVKVEIISGDFESMETGNDLLNKVDDLPKKTNDSPDMIQCSECPLMYTNNFDYYDHVNQKHLESVRGTWLKCPECPKYFPKDKSLKSHTEEAHPEIVATKSNPEPNFDTETDGPMKCPECQTVFKQVSTLFRHAAHYHYSHRLLDLHKRKFLMAADGTCSVCSNKSNVATLGQYVVHMGGKQRLITNFMTPDMAEIYARFPISWRDYEQFQSIKDLYDLHIKVKDRQSGNFVKISFISQPNKMKSNKDSQKKSLYKCPECDESFNVISCLYIHSAASHYHKQLAERYQHQYMMKEGKCFFCPNQSIDDVQYYIRHTGGKHRIIHQLMNSKLIKKYKLFPKNENNSDVFPMNENNFDELAMDENNFDELAVDENNSDELAIMEDNSDKLAIMEDNSDEFPIKEDYFDELPMNEKNSDELTMNENNSDELTMNEIDSDELLIKEEDILDDWENCSFSEIFCLLCDTMRTRKEFSNITEYKEHLAIDHFIKQISQLHMQTLSISPSGLLLCYICKKKLGRKSREFKNFNSLVLHLGSEHNCILDFVGDDLKTQLRELGVVKYPVHIEEKSVLRLIKSIPEVSHEEISEILFS